MNENSLYVFILFMTVFFIILYLIKARFGRMSNFFIAEDRMAFELKNQIKELEKKITALELTIQVLLDKLSEAKIPVPPIVLASYPPAKTLSRPVLLVYGEPEFGELDRNAMRRAGVSFFRLVSSNLEDLKNELQRRRSEGRMYDVVHLSSHGGSGTVMLNADTVSGIQLSDVLNGVRCVFLATCSNQLVADKLIGVVSYVIAVYEEIDTEDAGNFTYEFYKRYKESLNIEESFNGALAVMPSISEFVDLRIGGRL